MRWFFAVVMLLNAPAWALDVQGIGRLPVLHEGRIKPLETLARLSFDADANAQLAQALFAPGDALQAPLFTVRSDAVRSLLKLPEQEAYSYQDITPPLRAQRALLQQLSDKNAAEFTAHERAVWALYERMDRLTQLTGSMSLLLPLSAVLPEPMRARFDIQLADEQTYLSLSRHRQAIDAALQTLIAELGDDPTRYAPHDQSLALLSMRLAALAGTGRENHLLRVIPSGWKQGEWLSPWELINSGEASPESAALLAKWRALAMAYRAQEQAAWDAALGALALNMHAQPDVSATKLALEGAYYQLDLKSLSIVIYALALLLAIIAKPRAARMALLAGLCVHGIMIALRVIILDRPPVATLYESVLFVGLVAAFLCALMAKKYPPAVAIGAGVGGFLLSVSGLYAGDSDPMSMPMAVLNTNFWLATHVIIITAGYAAALVAGVLAHLALWRADAVAWRYLHGATLLALLLTSVGTILGGVWADQSWGRFWGWDPKENGALLIVLWLVWLLHSRMTKHIGANAFAALLAGTNIIVALSWFGVNLLGVGLHSYGFTDAAALGLFGFCAAELLLISGLYLRARKGVSS
jgi:hypothetical protein